MSSNLEPIPITSQKHDPAWKHCQMFKNGERVQLKCIYCGKIFKGGGIHRIKEHLAGHKGNAATCLRVPSDVRVLMQESLDGVVVKKRKKQKIAEEITNVNQVSTEIQAYGDQVDTNTGLLMIEKSDTLEPSSSLLVNREGTSNVAGERRKRGRGKNLPAEANALSFVPVELGARRVNNHVHMAIGRFLFDIGATMDAVNSVYFQPMVDAIVSGGSGALMPSCNDLQGWILRKLVEEAMVTSQQWVDCPYSKKPGGLAMLDLVSNQSFWSSCILIVRLTNPLLRVLRMVGSKKRPAMGYVYAGMYRAKETIKKELVKRNEYMVYWNIIDHWWEQQWHHPLHAAGFYLNPRFFYSMEGDMPNEMLSGMLDCIEKLIPDVTVQDKISKEINSYKNSVGDFGRKMAVRARDTLLPVEWWSTYGGSCPNLARLAIRVLSQTCSTFGLKHNHIPFEKLGYESKQHDSMQPLSSESASIVEDWVTGIDAFLDDDTYPDWTTLETLSVNTMLLRPGDEVEELGAGFNDHEIFNRMKEGDNENAEDNVQVVNCGILDAGMRDSEAADMVNSWNRMVSKASLPYSNHPFLLPSLIEDASKIIGR
ncbi:hypothetical protein GOBAR_AA15663 [Gossypium barbadense]|uniref:BED-type domain-containing protein n=1 Tax=Gossypium barbadense TaxID=3634 RepID=A0A2P5XNT4_GOSBA|nr:hypothetical protein GOBAR_AA15663 [Gossypium barbadense]